MKYILISLVVITLAVSMLGLCYGSDNEYSPESSYWQLLRFLGSLQLKIGDVLYSFGKAIEDGDDLGPHYEKIKGMKPLCQNAIRKFENYVPDENFKELHAVNLQILRLHLSGFEIMTFALETSPEKGAEKLLRNGLDKFSSAEKLYPVSNELLKKACSRAGLQLPEDIAKLLGVSKKE